ncbi:Ribokinase-like protein [Exophiala viscosa]|uniref:Ribokinase-like protein n=1 Tax=Exophiala viscosa TaxID=2486360 RepID=A0AAN6DYB0_9EURO|nr:Ribokinase-like protein [Exophiala viscosa]KAI1626203.1 Ribokinase-like protein [Exophiala viscosa]
MATRRERLAFITFGMFIIDEIEYLNGKASEQKIIGGAGTYAALGARLAAGAANALFVSWIVDMGSDFPPEFKAMIDVWRTSCIFRLDTSRLTTTAWNGYGPNEYRAFKYLTPKLRLDEYSLSDEQALARSFHMVCSPKRCISLVEGVMARRSQVAPNEPRPVFVWEPVPELCTPEEFDKLQEAARIVDIVSPNADEFASFFAADSGRSPRQAMVEKFLALRDTTPLDVALVVREGAQGCTMYQRAQSLHLHAFHQSAERVIDPTGGGNTFLGALAIAMTGTASPSENTVTRVLSSSSRPVDDRLLLAVLHATVAASYAIEQTGLPLLAGTSADDAWNGEPYQKRFMSFLEKEKAHIIGQLPGTDTADN